MSEKNAQPAEKKPAQQFPSQTQSYTEIDIAELFFRLLSSWKLILCLALVGAIAMGVYATYFITPTYSATAVIYVLNRSDSVINMSDLQLGTALTNDYIRVFSLWEVNAQVIEKLNLPYSYSTAKGMVSVSNPSSTRMLDITVTNSDPQRAADMANAYAEVAAEYIANNMGAEKPSIMSTALTPTNPTNSGKTKRIAVGFVLGAVLACGIVFLSMMLDDKYKTADDISKYTGLPTLATIPDDDPQNPHHHHHTSKNAKGGAKA